MPIDASWKEFSKVSNIMSEIKEMFSKWTIIVLKYYFWGYYTHAEFTHSIRRSRATFIIFSLQIIATFSMTVVIAEFLSEVNPYPSLTTINDWFQHSCMLIVQWSIIMESYAQQNMQKQFWQIFRKIDKQYHQHKSINLSTYLIKFLVYIVLLNSSQLIMNVYFISYEGFYPYYLVSYYFLIKTCQDAILYHLFYVELINYELCIIEQEAQQMSSMGRSSLISIDEKLRENRFKWIRNYYRSVYELSLCINSIFGWSHFAAVINCFYLVLTDFNWAYENIGRRSLIYRPGAFSSLHFNTVPITIYSTCL